MAAKATKLVSLRIDEQDYEKLQREAAALGLKPAVLARLLLRTSLNGAQTTPRRHSRREVAAARRRLEEEASAGRMPNVDAVELIRRMRDERAEHLMAVVADRDGVT